MLTFKTYFFQVLSISFLFSFTACNNNRSGSKTPPLNNKLSDSLRLIQQQRKADSISAIVSAEAAQAYYLEALKAEQAVHDRAIKPTAYGMDTVKQNPNDEAIYIIWRSGANGWGFRDGHHYKFKDRLSVRYKNDTLLGVQFDENRVQPFPTLYLWKYTTGNELKIPMDNFDVNQASKSKEDYENDNYASQIAYEAYNTPKKTDLNNTPQNPPLGQFNSKDYPDIEVNIISEKKFRNMQNSAVSWFAPDTVFKEKNGLLKLKLGKGERVFKDEQENAYSYLGQIKFINAYLVYWSCGSCEEGYYLLIDKTTGKQKYMQWGFGGVPEFSPDKKYILTLETNLNDKAELVVHKHIKDSAYIYALKEFEAWRPISKGFWGIDNCYYTPVIPSGLWGAMDEEKRIKMKYNFRYLKIKIKGPTPNAAQ